MAIATNNTAWYPEDFGRLIDQVVDAKSIAAQVSTVTPISGATASFPMLSADPATAWYAEGSEIALTDPTLTEVTVVPRKVAGLTQVSNEAVADSSPNIATQVGQSLARSIAKGIDAAYFGNTVTNGPSGLQSVAYSTVEVDSATTFAPANLASAKFVAMQNGAEITHFVLGAELAEKLMTTPQSDSTSALMFNEGVRDGMTLAGATILVSPHVAAGEFWAIDQSQVLLVRREGTEVVTDGSAAFAYDSVQVRATARVDFAVLNPAGVVRGYNAVA